MTQYVINIGTIPNDGTGDPLRTAFNETNLNFDQVFAAGPVLSNVQIANNTILTTNTNGNLVLAPNGIGVVQANVNLVPNTSNIRNLGSADRRWSTVYVQYANVSGGITVANLTAAGDVTVGGNLSVTGNIVYIGNLITDAKTIQLANTAGTANAANGSGITVGANDNIATFLYTSAGNNWNTNIGLQVAGLANVVSLSVNQTANAWLIAGNTITAPSGAVWTSDPEFLDEYITSAADGYINLTSRYADGNTASQIHLEHGLAQIVVDNGSEYIWQFNDAGNLILPGNTFAVNYANGTAVSLSGTYGNANVVANLANLGSNPISTTGNITGNYFIGNGSQLTGLSTNSISNGNSNVSIANANGNPTVTSAGNTWTFGGPQPDALYWPDGSFQATAFVGQALDLVNTGNASITSNSTGNTTYVWTFGDDGRLTFPGTPRIDTDADNFEVQAAESINFEANAVVNIYTDTSGTTYQWQFGDDGNLTLPGGGSIIVDGGDGVIGPDGDNMVISWDNEDLILRSLGSDVDVEADRDFNIRVNYDGGATDYLTKWVFGQDNEIVNITGNSAIITEAGDLNLQGGRNTLSSGNVQITAVDNGVAINTWTFDNTGNLTLPADGYLRVTSGIVGTGASPAPSLSGFSTLSAVTANISGNISGGNLISSATIYGNVDVVLGNIANASATRTRIVSDTTFSYIQTGNGTVGTTGNIVFSPYSTTTQQVVIDTASGNLTAAGNISGGNILGNGASMTGVVTKTTGTWTVTTGTATYSFTVPANGVYQLWVNGNIPNGIIVYNATVSVSNTNVPVIGQQFAWNYEGAGNPITFTSIPAQIIGTAGAISNASPVVGTTTNTFDFGINNSSGNTVTVNYGYTKIS
jgi:hypothetical protein